MRGGAVLETVLGLLVLVTAGAFLIYAQGQIDDGSGSDGYTLTARFSSVGDLNRGADVRVAGVPVGTVTTVRLDQDTYFAEAVFELNGEIQIPADSTAKIATAGLIGGVFIEIEPGGDVDMLQAGEEISFTQGAVDMFDLIGQAVMNRGSSGSGGSES
ncbi:MAG: outer membrane lipid asymmetry maintenance protein MlaD [Oceanicaulis sp.]|uniref:outer membrane lipid asymmetry maintenance protein MlaD n=1 Tax=Oceanicaulis sp. UBA2681 TaxID=1947007 RepID=UPI000C0969D1|nr:outer membrane lipid asymmetry maintenance protein MlaD [Oceanicaulis sp. UBA2681]MAP48456.1 outer membrane lipid asymmetry maintenance protein MlaD [Oceanicaulis sp.]HCR65063.1 outer membrane lipid asymmetry maintenance protein MlaD [Oceanicaulis sp.]|tara:strand:- start:158 stop:631 length:474 start_codon:yes stop_codon:yes gene_type:complete